MPIASFYQECVCPGCQERVLPQVRFYRKSPDAFVCPRCDRPLRLLANSAKRADRILTAALVAAFMLMTIGFLA